MYNAKSARSIYHDFHSTESRTRRRRVWAAPLNRAPFSTFRTRISNNYSAKLWGRPFFFSFEICYLNHSFLIFVQSDPRLNVVGTNTVSNHRLTVFRVLQVSPSNILLSPVTPRNRVDLASQHADSTGPSPFSCCSFSPPDISQVR